MPALHAIRTDARGTTSVEYAFIAVLIAIAAMGSTSAVGNALGTTLTTASTQMDKAPAIAGKAP